MHRSSDQSGTGPFHYRLFGLHVESELALPELRLVDPSNEPDVHIALTADGRPDGGTHLPIDDIADFYVDGGSRIRIVPKEGVPERNIRLFLLGSAMGMLLHQRGLLPLHANAVEIDGKAFAFMGPSGSGKSTLAAWFHDRGHRVIADDVCVVDFSSDGQPLAFEGLPRLRLWRDVLEATGRWPEQFEPSYSGDPSYDKFDVPLETAAGDDGLHLAAVYLLEKGDEAVLTRLNGLDSVEAIFANTYRGGFLDRVGGHRAHMESCIRLSQSVPVFCWVRQWGRECLDRQVATLLDHAQERAADGRQQLA
jgi:hypothetical protein